MTEDFCNLCTSNNCQFFNIHSHIALELLLIATENAQVNKEGNPKLNFLLYHHCLSHNIIAIVCYRNMQGNEIVRATSVLFLQTLLQIQKNMATSLEGATCLDTYYGKSVICHKNEPNLQLKVWMIC
jgi:hypothetical protein